MQTFKQVIEAIIERSGGSIENVNLNDFMESINHSFIFGGNYWLGIKILKNPLDLMILQELIYEKKPRYIIECGTAWGGSAYYLAHLMDIMNIDGKVFTIDNEIHPLPPHPQNTLMEIEGQNINLDFDVFQPYPVHNKIDYINSNCLTTQLPTLSDKTMVILDCDHSEKHVYKEMEKFSKFVTPGQYLIVEDTDTPEIKKGPAYAIEKFLSKNKNYTIDKRWDKYGVSSNLGGYLLRLL